MKDLSVEATTPVEPPTPRTKSLHLKLGTSLLTLKKSRQQSRGASPVTSATDMIKTSAKSPQIDLNCGSKVEAMEVDSNIGPQDKVYGTNDNEKVKQNTAGKQSAKPRSRPSSPIPRLLNAVFNSNSSKASDEMSETKQKSFKLGFSSLSLFPRKKSSKLPESADAENASLAQEGEKVNSTPPLKAPVLLPPQKPKENTPLLPKDQANVSVRQSTPFPQTPIEFVTPPSQSTPKLTTPKLSLAPPSHPQIPARKADTPRPKVTPKQLPLNPVLKSSSTKNDIQEINQEVRLATPVKRGCTSPRKDLDSPVKMLNPLVRMKSTPEKATAQIRECTSVAFPTPPPSAVRNSFLEKSGEGGSSGFFDDGKEMPISTDLFGESEESPFIGEDSFLGGDDTQKSKVSSGSGFFTNNPGDGKFGSFFEEENKENPSLFSLSFGDGEEKGGSEGFSLF